MQIKNTVIFSSTNAADGSWIDVSNLVSMSVQVVNLEGLVYIEVSNDPLVNIDNPSAVIAAPSAPTLSQSASPYPGSFVGQGTYFVKLTYVTKFGETTASAESSLTVTDGNFLQIAAPGLDATGIATGYNIYIGKVTNTEVLQTVPAYTPQWVSDSTPGQHFAGSGALPVNTPFSLRFGYVNTGIVPPVSNTGGGANVGINPLAQSGNPTGNLVGITATDYTTIAVFADANNGGQAMWSPSSMNYKWLRVRKSNAAQTKLTQAFICGANG